MACDIAVEETEQGDYWVISVASFDTLGRMYVREVIRERMLTSSFLEHVTQLVKKWHPSRVGIENTAFQKTLNKTYREYAATKGINIPWHELERGKSSKRKRIMALQPRVERGDFYVDERMKNLEYVIEEMTTYPRAPFDDVLDTMADLESMFYSGPEVAKQPEATNTYNAYHGSLEDDEDTHEDASSIIEQLV
jgi:predicted phage terminase large subunit-like protein